MSLLDIFTYLSCLALTADIVLQVRRLHTIKSSEDLSIFGMSIRFIAIIVLLVKFIAVGSVVLAIGQSLIIVVFAIYYAQAVMYFRRDQALLAKRRR